ncbi:BCCT family transporter [Candidatus Parabeggiatoa sp. HSG14]|uniref:BCCT family transporter n=1 Tax=Candidatus Parabeggiatoa sp. HSG14 TaxID=3055593 RepID=UPI0025A71121|nr:BCCT family transporter [Thiotrichales bacterium HSG14]
MDSSQKQGTKSYIVFFISVILCGAIGIWGVIDPEQMAGAALGMTGFALKSLDWFFLLLCTGFLILSVYMAFGPYGHIRLGKDEDRPEFSTLSWLSMLFAAGMGAGLIFWGVAEPMYHYLSPPGISGKTPEAARMAMIITNLHWGLHAWSIYAICALVIAYFSFRKETPSLISSPIQAEFGCKHRGLWCHTADIVGVLAVIFGLAGSLTMGVLQVRAGLGEVFNVPANDWVSIIILALMTMMFMISASTGIDKGIKILSNINMIIAVTILLIIMFAGPTLFIMEIFITSIGDYFSSLINISFKLYPYKDLTGWTSGWTLTYLIWWLAWGPFVGIFIARISRGRTIREFMIGVVLIPTLFSILWFAAFGGTALYIEMFGGGGLAEIVLEDVSKALFALFTWFPLPEVLSVLALILIFVFLVTSADSGTFVVSMMTSHGNLNPSTSLKLIWGIIIGVLTAGTVLTGSVTVAKAMAITGAIPFSLILILQIIAFLRTIRKEKLSQQSEMSQYNAQG